MPWRKMLAYLTGTVDQELLLRNEYLAAENRILRSKIQGRLLLTDPERITLARIGKRLGRQALQGLSAIVRPDTILAWHRRLVAQKFDGSAHRRGPGRPRVPRHAEKLVLRIARENRSWGYDIAGLTPHPHQEWMKQIARSVTMEAWGFLSGFRFLIHDRDGKFCPVFRRRLESAGVRS
ncbi:MAG: hypothetical protein ACYSUN_08365, partial [Planctomycetota bacterium]